MSAVSHHLLFFAVCTGVTVVVGHTLFRHGRPFVIECVHGDEPLADAVNRLLLAGYYLLNIGLVAVAVRFGRAGGELVASLEVLAHKVGWILLIQGGMHCANMIVLSELRRRKRKRPLDITEFIEG